MKFLILIFSLFASLANGQVIVHAGVQISPNTNTLTFPTTGGSNTNVLTTNGSGVLSWASAGGGGGMSNPMTTTGDQIYSSDNSGTPARLGIGTTGQFLGTAGTTPAWHTFAGTTNQITISNSSGDLTLATPQNIHTGATPQFLRLGLGAAADATASLYVSQAIAAATIANGFWMQNSNAATSGNQMYSPAIHLTGFGFGTTAGTSQAIDYRWYIVPTQITVPIGTLVLDASVAGGSYTTLLNILTNGAMSLPLSSINATRTDGFVLTNLTAATSGQKQQFSPSLVFSGTADNTSSGDVSETNKFSIQNEPQTVAGTTTANLTIKKSIAGGAYSEVFGITSAGAFRINGSKIGQGIQYGDANGVLNTLQFSTVNRVAYASSANFTFGLNANSHFWYDGGSTFNLGIGKGISDAASYPLHLWGSDAATNTITTEFGIDHSTSGTPAAGYGSQILMLGQSSTTASQNMGAIAWDWVTATHASRASEMNFWGVFNASSLTKIATLALTAATTSTLTLGVAGTTLGNLALTGNTSGTVTITPSATAGTQTYTIRDQGAAANFVFSNSSGGAASCGVVTLVAGTATITTSFVKTGAIIQLTFASQPLAASVLYISAITNNTSFVITSINAAETATVNWQIVNP